MIHVRHCRTATDERSGRQEGGCCKTRNRDSTHVDQIIRETVKCGRRRYSRDHGRSAPPPAYGNTVEQRRSYFRKPYRPLVSKDRFGIEAVPRVRVRL
jgi:hypothetical protein